MQNIQIAFRQILVTEKFQKVGVEFPTSLNGQTWAWGTGAYLGAKLLVFIFCRHFYFSTCWY